MYFYGFLPSTRVEMQRTRATFYVLLSCICQALLALAVTE